MYSEGVWLAVSNGLFHTEMISFCLVFFHGKVGCVAGGSEQMKLPGQARCDPELARFGCFGGCVFDVMQQS